uniref:Uncharacterized protein n=1 Tax=Anguilla anguilla TaxID=7936 RepID=A0A0E9RJY6_ANGAN
MLLELYFAIGTSSVLCVFVITFFFHFCTGEDLTYAHVLCSIYNNVITVYRQIQFE